MRAAPIKIYGSEGCHKTQFYVQYLDDTGLPYLFQDVEADPEAAAELRALYESGKLNFPTITIGAKKLRNPTIEELEKWLNKLIPARIPLIHDAANQRYNMDINGQIAKVDYKKVGKILYLLHSEVPHDLRGRGIGKVLVLKTFQKLTEEGHQAKAICRFIRAVAMRDPHWGEIILL